MKLDLTDIEFAAQSTPVNAHPLFFSTKTAETKSAPEGDGPSVGEDPLSGVEVGNRGDEFVDPLGAFQTSNESDIDVTNLNLPLPKKQIERKVEAPKIEVVTSRLLNTLQQEQENVIPNLDPVINGFAPWTSMKERILKEFTATDQLSLETSYLNREAEKQRQRLVENHAFEDSELRVFSVRINPRLLNSPSNLSGFPKQNSKTK